MACHTPGLTSAGVTIYRRFQSAVPNRRGTFPGVFALANGLAWGGLLSAEDHAWWAAENARGDALYADPSHVVPGCYDREANPGARAWFKETAVDLIALTAAYLRLLDRYDVPWVELRTASPGRVVYEDDVQVVTVPFTYPADWPWSGLSLPAIPRRIPSSSATRPMGRTARGE